MLLRKLWLLFFITAASCFYIDYGKETMIAIQTNLLLFEFLEIKPASKAIHELFEERYNPYYKPPEDCTDDELIELIEESLTTFGEVHVG